MENGPRSTGTQFRVEKPRTNKLLEAAVQAERDGDTEKAKEYLETALLEESVEQGQIVTEQKVTPSVRLLHSALRAEAEGNINPDAILDLAARMEDREQQSD